VKESMIDLPLTGGTVVTIDTERCIIRDGAVAIAGGRLVAVGPASEFAAAYQARKTLACKGKAILPGLIDAHGHGGHSLIKTIGADTGAVPPLAITGDARMRGRPPASGPISE
jgi:5-methylthioadenosine/S-adenosylhomocysteine deaminase